jgi:hypothetical protein
VPLAAEQKCTLRANPAREFAKPPAGRLQKRLQAEKKPFFAVEFFSHATPEAGGRKSRRGDSHQPDWSLTTGAGAIRPSAESQE